MTGHVHKLAVPLCVACLGLAACGSTDGGSTDSGTSGAGSAGGDSGTTTLRFAAIKQGGGYPTPFGAVRGPGRLLTTFVFDTLAFPDVTGEPKPWLAKSWQQDASGTTWTFQLRKANWQDGKPLTSADVAFSFDYQINGPGAKSGAAQGLDYIKSVTADGPERVVFKLKSPRADFLDGIAGAFGVAIIPKHIWSKVTDPGRFQGKRALIGSGPYRLKSFDTTTNTFDFVANKDFYLGRPKVQEIQIVPEANPLLALQRGQLDSASASGGNGVIPKPLFEQLSKRFKVLTAPGEFNESLFFNVDGGFPYTERAFRQGVAYALNRRNMLQVLANGRGVPGSAGGLGPSNPFLNKDAPAYAFDKGKAAALLDKVGLKLPKGATFRVKPDGSAFTIPLLTSSADNQQAMLVQQYLRAVGLNSKLKSVDQPTSDAADAKGNYKMAVVHFGGLAGDPSVLVQRFASYFKGKSFTRVSGYRNPAFDKLAKQQTTTIDKAARRKLVDQMQVILATDVPEIPLYIPQQVSFVNPKVFSGWAYTPGCPPCGAGMNKRMLVSGSNAPVPGN